MKRLILAFACFAFLGSVAVAQDVATAEILGLDMTRPHSTHVFALMHDGSVGEAIITIQALDANGNPVEGAHVDWSVHNRGSSVAYVVGSSADGSTFAPVTTVSDVAVHGGTTDADGRAYLVVDAFTDSDIVVSVTVGGVPAKAYNGSDLRVVWF